MTHLLLVGNPNCGKTTLFNTLTGANQRVGNWAGVTVEKKSGEFILGDQSIQLTDLPGIYSLSSTQGLSHDELIATQAVANLEADCLINIIDACHLERHLYLTSQILELGKPVIIALNMMDVAHHHGITINVDKLSKELGCPIIPIQAHKGIGVSLLHEQIINLPRPPKPLSLTLSQSVLSSLHEVEKQLINQGDSPAHAYYQAFRLAEGGNLVTQEQDLDILLADARYQKVHQTTLAHQKKQSDASEHFTAKLDKIVLNRFLAIPIFFALMYSMFLFAINIGGAFQDFFDISTDTIFVQGAAWLLQQTSSPNWLVALIAHGVGRGINTTLTFIPVIAGMFFFLSLLETSGYMARAAFVVDKIMRTLGLPGKAFVPMIVGFGCNVPAIMAARTLDSERDRLLTIMMSPFMSCSARLAIYAVFVAAFFPSGGALVVFSLYLLGILMAVLTGFLLRKTLFSGDASPLILELPTYHKPSFKRLIKETGLRLRYFIIRAGKLIIPICVTLGALNAITLGGTLNTYEASSQSLLSAVGQWITPLFSPMGISQDNWPATVGLLTGMLAKEVVVGTLNALYMQSDQLTSAAIAQFDLWTGLSNALWSIPHNFSELGRSLINPIAAGAFDNQLSSSVYGVMVQRFDGAIGAYAYLLFVLLYVPCVSTMAVIRQEASRQLMWISIIWSFLVAYAAAVLFYQAAKFLVHPTESILWILGIFFILTSTVSLFYYTNREVKEYHVITDR